MPRTEGSFGVIYRGVLKSRGELGVAVKLLNIQDKSARAMFEREVTVLKRQSNCLFVIKYLGWLDKVVVRAPAAPRWAW